MIAPCFRRTMGGCLLALAFLSPQQISAQGAALVYISNVIGTESGGIAIAGVEEQTAAALDNLGEALRKRGLDYADVVVSNVFLRDTRHFQAGGQSGQHALPLWSHQPESGHLPACNRRCSDADPSGLRQHRFGAGGGGDELRGFGQLPRLPR